MCLCSGCDGCIARRGAVVARVWEVCVFRHASPYCIMVILLKLYRSFCVYSPLNSYFICIGYWTLNIYYYYVSVLSASCGSSQCCVLHDLLFVNSGRGCKRRPYGRGILQRWSHNCLVGSHACLLLFTPSCCSEWFYDL